MKKQSGTKKTAKRITITRPLVFAGEDAGLWMARRVGLFSELRKHGLPRAVVDAVEKLEWHRPARWVTPTGGKPQDGERALLCLKPEKKLKQTPAEEGEFRESLRRFESAFEVSGFHNAGEVLAYALLKMVRSQEGLNSPARAHSKLPRSVIAEAALTILEDQNSDGSHLIDLLRELLEVKLPNQEETRQYQAREQAVQFVAQAPHLGVRTVARAVGVNPGTMSRWLKEPQFKYAVEHHRKLLADIRIRSQKPKRKPLGTHRISAASERRS
ncbi:hypothetical protein [Bradyrhizobium japonicum]|uniref:hypothetical protein n=1 Tax=Bradyrhizobium japonicum TaxID=375 RepID=UPI0012FDF4B5|nr:hypothetical protein [Bradyrhizobium japonicum]